MTLSYVPLAWFPKARWCFLHARRSGSRESATIQTRRTIFRYARANRVTGTRANFTRTRRTIIDDEHFRRWPIYPFVSRDCTNAHRRRRHNRGKVKANPDALRAEPTNRASFSAQENSGVRNWLIFEVPKIPISDNQ